MVMAVARDGGVKEGKRLDRTGVADCSSRGQRRPDILDLEKLQRIAR